MQLPPHTTIGDLFASDIQFVIPAYQRAYSWEADEHPPHNHLPQFVQDLREHPRPEPPEPSKPYYLGHYLFESQFEGQLRIIDGQQRLTTIVIFFRCLTLELLGRLDTADQTDRHLIHNLDPKRLHETYLKRGQRTRLLTVDDDRSFFDALLTSGDRPGSDPTRSQKRLQDAKDYFSKTFRKTRSTLELIQWADLVEKAVITCFEVEDKVQATQIFAFQNDRGKKLTDLEKLKAYLMLQTYLNSEVQEEIESIRIIEDHFTKIYQLTEQIHLLYEDDVLRHHVTAYMATWDPPLENVKKTINSIKDRTERVVWIKKFCNDLRKSFEQVKMLEALARNHECIMDLLLLDASNSWPMLLRLYNQFGVQITASPVREVLCLIEIALFKFGFMHGNAINDLPTYAKEYDHNIEALRETLERVSQWGFRGWGHFNTQFASALNGNYHWHKAFRYLLWKYENSIRRERDYDLSPTQYVNEVGDRAMDSTLDHITPRNPCAEDPVRDELFARDYLNNIGNLVLMPHGMNSSFRNKLPMEKYSLLVDSSLASHREVGRTIQEDGTWGPEQIEARKQKIIRFALDRWRAKEPEPAGIKSD